MPDKPSLKYLFIINPGSGRNSADSWKSLITDFFKSNKDEFEIYVLPAHFTPTQIKDHISKLLPQQVIAVGGDGTVTMLANLLVGTDIPLGILPGGSANGMAKELGIPSVPEDALKVIVKGFQKKIDLIRLNNKDYCLHLSDIGLNARLVKYFDEGKLRGKIGYARVIFKTLWYRQKMQVSIRTGETQIKREAFMVALANARMYGTGAVINPNGKPDDGQFEIIILRKLSFFTVLKMMFRPRIFDPKKIEIIPCTSAEITTKRAMHFQTDGEYKGKLKRITAVIVPGAVRMILPREQ